MATLEIQNLEQYFGLEPDFFNKLQVADGWTLVVKLHSLFESACTLMLTVTLRRDTLRDPFAQMDMGSQKTWKARFCSCARPSDKAGIKFH